MERNEELATENLSLKPQLEEKQQELVDLVRALYAPLSTMRTYSNTEIL